MIHACEYYAAVVRTQDGNLGYQYDKTIRKLHNYEQEMECPDCWDPESQCQLP